jgi:predicted transcriptional regulator
MRSNPNSLSGSKRSKPFVDVEDWHLREIQAGLADLDKGEEISHERVAKWLRSWGGRSESKPPQ